MTTPTLGFDAAFAEFAEQLAKRLTESVIEALAEYDAGKQPAPELVSGAELARILSVSRTTIHRLRVDGAPCVKLGDNYRFQPAEVLRWLKEQSWNPTRAK